MSQVWTHVYVMAQVRGGEHCAPTKIGISNNFHARFQAIAGGAPMKVEGIVALPLPSKNIARMIEAATHELLDDKRINGEWFDVCPIRAGVAVCMMIKFLWDELGIPETQTLADMRRMGATNALKQLLDALPRPLPEHEAPSIQ